jgi:hypothetical protein
MDDQIQNLLQAPGQLVQEGVQFLKRCQKRTFSPSFATAAPPPPLVDNSLIKTLQPTSPSTLDFSRLLVLAS